MYFRVLRETPQQSYQDRVECGSSKVAECDVPRIASEIGSGRKVVH